MTDKAECAEVLYCEITLRKSNAQVRILSIVQNFKNKRLLLTKK